MKNRKDEDIDERIERVTRSVAAKKIDISIWNTEKKAMDLRNRRIRYFRVSATASVGAVAAIGIWYFMIYWKESDLSSVLPPSSIEFEYSAKQKTSNYSGETSNIEAVKALIESKKYDEALEAIDAIIADTIIDSTLSLEKKKEMKHLHATRAYELEWLKIKTLFRLNKNEEAEILLKNYSEQEGPHQNEALEKLNNINQLKDL